MYLPVRQRILGLLFLQPMIAGLAVAQPTPQNIPVVPAIETIIARMEQARAENRAQLRPYKVIRDYTLFGKEKHKARFEATAHLTFVPPNSRKYSIQRAEGLGIGEKIVRQMLDGETQIVQNYGSTDISPANYNLRLLRQEFLNGQLCHVIELSPRRKDNNLLHGHVWVDTNTYLLRRLEGKPAKGPSWWLKDARIAFVYGDVNGMWLQTSSESNANVRLLGPFTMVSRDVSYEIGEPLAQGAR